MEQNNYINNHHIGNYITPAIWTSEGHALISACLGADWKEKYLVWDCCCGQQNLTCGYTFAELYSSTKDARDITSCRRYHRKANSFTYDFLEDDITLFDALLTKTKTGYTLRVSDFYCSKLYRHAPGLIMALLDKKPIVFWINPPYGTAGNQRKGEAKHSGAAKTAINTLMLRASMGSCSQQLYAQFLFRIGMIKELFGLPECHIALYSTPALQCSPSFRSLRAWMKTKWSFSAGFLFPANAFAGCSNKWSVLFALWKDVASTAAGDSVTVSIKCEKEGRVIDLGNKNLYNLDDTASASDWVRSAAKLTQTARVGFTMSNAVTITDGACMVSDEIMGYAVMDANTVEKNNCYVTLINRKFRGHIAAYPITERSFDRIISLFSARRLITGTYAGWMNGKDEYRIPDTENDRYREWLNDCLVYALFNTASQMSSLRNISHNGVVHHLRNEFFFMSENEIWNLASGALFCEDENESVMEDIAHFSGERFVYKRLLTAELSAEARRVLDMAKELVRRSFRNRMVFDSLHKEYHINAWDAGWYQIKGLLSEFHQEELDAFYGVYRELEDKMRPMVYDLGFLL